jgi:hypothetical protein
MTLMRTTRAIKRGVNKKYSSNVEKHNDRIKELHTEKIRERAEHDRFCDEFPFLDEGSLPAYSWSDLDPRVLRYIDVIEDLNHW